ncbi:terminase small subunit [Gorillibacterium timonense]|uniref:terminase small subunit n=1 Tax=Gorillibacterium timonense TaxID=1689269 RepID=UPI00071E599B|nr:terminase small subunit [Gorillibacterium timonense]
MALTAKQKAFVAEYLVDLNATQAAIRAGYSARNADKIGPELLGKTRVAEAIQEAMSKREQRTEITQDMVLRELAKIGFSDMRTYTKWSNRGIALIDSDSLAPEQSACVAEVTQTITESGGSIKFKLHDKVSALEKIGRHLGMFKDKVELTGDDGGPLQVLFSDKMRPPE